MHREMIEEVLKTFELNPQDASMILIWGVTFIFVWKLLDKYFFSPYLALLAAREAATEGARNEAQDVAAQAEKLNSQYETRIFEHRVKVMARRNDMLATARKEAAQIAENAEKQAQSEVSAARVELAKQVEALRAEAPRQAAELAEVLVRKVVA